MAKKELREKCGVFAISGHPDAAYLTHLGLFTLQHRGQEAAGIVSSDGNGLYIHKGEGLVAQVFSKGNPWKKLRGEVAIGHDRYATSSPGDAQPVLDRNRTHAIAENGNDPEPDRVLVPFLKEKNIFNRHHNDTEMKHAAIGYYKKQGAPLEEAVAEAQKLFVGAYSLLAMDTEKMIALRDPYGIRPFAMGTLENGAVVFSSETAALDVIGATYQRDIKPGEMVVVEHGSNAIQSVQLTEGQQKIDPFEYIYFGRPDSVLLDRTIHIVRKQMGAMLAAEEGNLPACDIVIPVPDSGTSAAIGYANATGIPYDAGFVSNRYSGRTFITPHQGEREKAVDIKLNAIREVVKGKKVKVIDDSIVRGTSSRKFVKRLRDAGAREVHLGVPSPQILYPNFYGINTPRQKELIAANMTHDAIKHYLDVDSLQHLSVEGMVEAIGLPAENLDLSSFNGVYPIDIGRRREEIIYLPAM